MRYLSENQGIDANIMLLIEDLARVGDKIVEEARKEKEDLKQQVCIIQTIQGAGKVYWKN